MKEKATSQILKEKKKEQKNLEMQYLKKLQDMKSRVYGKPLLMETNYSQKSSQIQRMEDITSMKK